MSHRHDLGYLSIVARNYLPQALTLFRSVQRHEPGRPFHLLVIDGLPQEMAEIADRNPELTVHDLALLGLEERELLNLAMIYDVVEFSTAVKPLAMLRLLETYDQVAYLDPDLYLVSPLAELPALIDEHGVVLTPHILQPIPPGTSTMAEGANLTVGVHNLGFCAVGRGKAEFLEWWWSHLRRECLIYPLLGLFVDQKWVDVGSVLFSAHSLKHPGYNVGHWNLHEREMRRSGDGGYVMAATDEPLRFLHFSGFDPLDPESISDRQNESLQEKGLGSQEFSELCRVYADEMLVMRDVCGAAPEYRYLRDTEGNLIKRRHRRTYRSLLVNGVDDLPSPFLSDEAPGYRAWRRGTIHLRARNAATDAALAFKYAFPDAFAAAKRSAPALFSRVRQRMLTETNVRR